ncbi:MAG: tRNA lysidine(34) synthetase TilS [Saprospirales bacterium]|nr:MAG: tRNA lysidine(34) synthetase TilS [Saprospirales bacterium]
MKKKVKRFIRNRALFEKENKLLVAVSGGMDSVALCHFLKLEGYPFEIAHVNYGLRGEESDSDEEFVKNLSAQLEVNCHILVATERLDKEKAIQEKARKIRYQWFSSLLKSEGLDYILTAHHSDDSTETLLMNLFRGSGPGGLSGIAPNPGNIRRPFLTVKKNEIQQWAEKKNLQWREDLSNRRSDYNRNFIRNELIPLIETRWKGFGNTCIQTAEIMHEAKNITEFWAGSELISATRDEGGITILDLAKIRESIAPKTMLHYALKDISINAVIIKDILKGRQSGKEWYSADRQFRLLLEPGEKLSVEKISGRVNFTPMLIPENKSKIKTPLGILSINKGNEKNNQSIVLDGSKLNYPMELRKWRPGDYFHPAGMRGNRKKIKQFLTDLKLGKRKKENTLVLCSRGAVVWVVGLRADQRFVEKAHSKKKDRLTLRWDQRV